MGGGKQSVVSRLGYLRLLKLLAGNHCTCRKLHPSAMPFFKSKLCKVGRRARMKNKSATRQVCFVRLLAGVFKGQVERNETGFDSVTWSGHL
jgi:hypothetical protein